MRHDRCFERGKPESRNGGLGGDGGETSHNTTVSAPQRDQEARKRGTGGTTAKITMA